MLLRIYITTRTRWAELVHRLIGLGDDLEAERIGVREPLAGARPWPERPVSAANKSGNDTAATRRAITYSRSLLARRNGDRGQTTAEYALVIIGAAAVALLLLAWATGSGKISTLLDKVVDTVANMVR